MGLSRLRTRVRQSAVGEFLLRRRHDYYRWLARRELARLPTGPNRFAHELAIGTMFKNEAPYLLEWIEFHRLMGVTKFFLYDNGSSDHYRAVVAPHVADGVVEIIDWPMYPGQTRAFNDCLKRSRFECRWLALIDVDEFLYAPGAPSLPGFLSAYASQAALAVNWIMFTSSGHVLKPDGLVIENFTACQPRGDRHCKLILNPRRTARMLGAHEAMYWQDGFAVNERMERVTAGVFPPSIEQIRINHYWSKSVEEFVSVKLSRGNVTKDAIFYDMSGFFRHERKYSQGTDLLILDYLSALRVRVGGLAEQP